MDTLQAIRTRRSVRAFTPDPVPGHVLERVLAAGAYAPSAKNVRNWRFVVLEGEAREAVIGAMKAAADAMKDLGPMHSIGGTVRAMQQAPVLITVHNTGALTDAMTRSRQDAGNGVTEDVLRVLRDLEIQGVAAAIQNMLLAAHAQGLGSLWIGDFHYTRAEIEDLLHRVCPHEMIAAVSLGYPSGQSPDADRSWRDVSIRADKL